MLNFIFAIALLFAAQPALSQGLGLKDLISQATENSPAVHAAKEQLTAEDLGYDNSVAAFFPSLDLSASHGAQRTLPEATAGEPWVSQLSLELSEKLYDNGVSWNRKRSAQHRLDVAKLSFQQKRDEVALEVAQAYFDYSLATHLVAANESLEKMLTSQFKLAEAQYQQGLKARKDFLRFRGELQRMQIEGFELTTRQKNARQKIAMLIGKNADDAASEALTIKPWPAEAVVIPEVSEKPIDLASTKQAKLVELEEEIAKLEVALVEKKHAPEIDLSTKVTYATSEYMSTGVRPYERDGVHWVALLNLNYNLWDFGTRRRDVAIAVAKKNATTYASEVQMRELQRTLQVLQSDLALNKRNLQMAKELMSLEQESFSILSSEYRQGRVDYMELVDGLKNLSAAKESLLQTTNSQLMNIARYKFYEGSIDALDL